MRSLSGYYKGKGDYVKAESYAETRASAFGEAIWTV